MLSVLVLKINIDDFKLYSNAISNQIAELLILTGMSVIQKKIKNLRL